MPISAQHGCACIARFGKVKTILVPVDFSPVTASVMDEAVALAESAGGRLVVLHVQQPPSVVADYGPPMGALVMPVADTTGATSAPQLAKWKRRVEARKLPVVATRLSGVSPSEVIVAEAKRIAADYIVMGSHGHTAFHDLLVGSTTGGVLKKSPCPVIVIPARHLAPFSSPEAAKV